MGGKKKGGSGKSTGGFGSPTGSPGEKIEGSSAPVNAAISVAPRTTTTAVEDIAPAAVADAKGDADAKADADAEAKAKADAEAKAKADVEAKAKADAEAKATADIEATAKTAEAKHVAAAYAAADATATADAQVAASVAKTELAAAEARAETARRALADKTAAAVSATETDLPVTNRVGKLTKMLQDKAELSVTAGDTTGIAIRDAEVSATEKREKEKKKAAEAATRVAEQEAASLTATSIRESLELEAELVAAARSVVEAPHSPGTTTPGDKICFICGEECSSRPRQRDDAGRYACLSCVQRKLKEREARSEKSAAAAAVAIPANATAPSRGADHQASPQKKGTGSEKKGSDKSNENGAAVLASVIADAASSKKGAGDNKAGESTYRAPQARSANQRVGSTNQRVGSKNPAASLVDTEFFKNLGKNVGASPLDYDANPNTQRGLVYPEFTVANTPRAPVGGSAPNSPNRSAYPRDPYSRSTANTPAAPKAHGSKPPLFGNSGSKPPSSYTSKVRLAFPTSRRLFAHTRLTSSFLIKVLDASYGAGRRLRNTSGV